MTHKLGDTVTFYFTTHDPATGNVADADVLTCAVYGGTAAAPILEPVPVKRDTSVGEYHVTFAATVENGFAVGESFNVVVSAEVALVTAKGAIAAFTLDGKRVSDLHDITAEEVEAEVAEAHGGGSWRAPVADVASTLKKVTEVLALVRRIKHR